tara:strand:+ start:618 stop:1412 length:795 start_codon:yes stop_codon:yes gene_type:complete
MKNITVFTSNQPRHLALIHELSKVSKKVYAIIESNTVHPGKVEGFFKKSQTMQNYFSKVTESEKKFFGNLSFLPKNVSPLVIKMGDLNMIDISILNKSLESDLFIVFGSSFIKGELIDFLINKKAINIHMGVSPFYRGSSCNFWAMKNADYGYVGSTIHMLSEGLDSGEILFHALPSFESNPFDYTMKAVKAAQKGLIKHIKNKSLNSLVSIKQNIDLEISYTRNSEFNDNVAYEFLNQAIPFDLFNEKVKQRNLSEFLNPYIY